MTHSSLVSNVAARIGSAEFFEPLIFTEPERDRPPCTNILSINCENESVYTLIVLLALNFSVPERAEVLTQRLGLIRANFQRDRATGNQMVTRIFSKPPENLRSLRAAIECGFRIVLHLALERHQCFRCDV